MTLRGEDDRDERRAATRALLATPFVDAHDPVYALIRRHEGELARAFQTTFGYRLEIGSTAARVSGPPTAAGLHRPLRIRPQSASGQRRPVDAWPALSDRGCVLLLLTLAALERGTTQTVIAELARAVELAGAGSDPVIAVDFRARAERVAFADGLDLLCSWGVLQHTSGTRESYARREQDDNEALLTVDRRRLAMLLRDPVAALHATRIEDLMSEAGHHPPTPEGENRAHAEALVRRLAEDPALVLDDLDADVRTYFLGQRARIEDAVATATGCIVERRAEGSALIVEDRALTDVAFPTNATVKQVALLLCDTLATRLVLSAEALLDAVHKLVRRHGQHWDRDPADPVQVRALAEAATALLVDCDLASREPHGALRARPLIARFRLPTVTTTTPRAA
ncbi:MAG TPA: TIGR02678 family protein [Solirubrobacteraceae bacterium]|nr:TIGR02678 family protein [Solirubrobacteraceae bacterium]